MFHSGETIAREECAALLPRFGGAGLLPAVATDAGSGAVLMLAWMRIPTEAGHPFRREAGQRSDLMSATR